MGADMHNFTHNQIAVVIRGGTSGNVRDGLAHLGDLELEVLAGPAGIAHIDADGSEHGALATLKRSMQEEQAPISMLADALETGDEVLFVHYVADDDVESISTALAELGATLMFHFSDYTWRRLST